VAGGWPDWCSKNVHPLIRDPAADQGQDVQSGVTVTLLRRRRDGVTVTPLP
jgi:hypothetical protein